MQECNVECCLRCLVRNACNARLFRNVLQCLESKISLEVFAGSGQGQGVRMMTCLHLMTSSWHHHDVTMRLHHVTRHQRPSSDALNVNNSSPGLISFWGTGREAEAKPGDLGQYRDRASDIVTVDHLAWYLSFTLSVSQRHGMMRCINCCIMYSLFWFLLTVSVTAS